MYCTYVAQTLGRSYRGGARHKPVQHKKPAGLSTGLWAIAAVDGRNTAVQRCALALVAGSWPLERGSGVASRPHGGERKFSLFLLLAERCQNVPYMSATLFGLEIPKQEARKRRILGD